MKDYRDASFRATPVSRELCCHLVISQVVSAGCDQHYNVAKMGLSLILQKGNISF